MLLLHPIAPDDLERIHRRFQSATESSLAFAWQLMRDKRRKFDSSEPSKEYLGCGQNPRTLTPSEIQQRLEHIHTVRIDPANADVKNRCVGRAIRGISYDKCSFFRQVVDKYLAHSGKPLSDLKPFNTATPIDDHQIPPEDFASKGAL